MKKVSDQCPTLLSHTRWPNGDAFLFLAEQHQKSDFTIKIHGTNFLARGRTKFLNA